MCFCIMWISEKDVIESLIVELTSIICNKFKIFLLSWSKKKEIII